MDEHAGKVWTYDDLATLPDDGQRYEILDGELVVSPAPSLRHQRVLTQLLKQLFALEYTGRATIWVGPTDVKLSPTRVVEPDVVVVSHARREILREQAIEGAPDLVVEVVSPSNRKHDLTVKRRFYARIGVREYWIVDPESETVEVLALADGVLGYRQDQWAGPGDRVRSVVFGVEVDVTALFEDHAPTDQDD